MIGLDALKPHVFVMDPNERQSGTNRGMTVVGSKNIGRVSVMELTPIGAEFESIIAAVLLFLFGGIICFLACFGVTHCYLCYKRRILRKKRRRDRSEDFNYTTLDLESQTDEVYVTDGKKLKVKNENPVQRPSNASLISNGSSETTGSTKSTNT
ncbi:unnamed protein product [Bursaphelenchus xylophilus]|uniref:(pine wood nematode) hypothetical protein n=1 Tax=Bursaphelenchus xylophilus TaxID=6326 RepID=A0A1I7RRI4_BURXY|nr:unnamed protein product [Bursaphelenchus xylophilus]CAG9131062.1 unnamed protein product [Bursaphelenchus xylophilus]